MAFVTAALRAGVRLSGANPLPKATAVLSGVLWHPLKTPPRLPVSEDEDCGGLCPEEYSNMGRLSAANNKPLEDPDGFSRRSPRRRKRKKKKSSQQSEETKYESEQQDSGLECPPDSEMLGRSTWTFLHTMAAFYPSNATAEQQQAMTSMLTEVSMFYPCRHCADHMKAYMSEFPPRTESSVALSLWLCQFHNEVNEMKGKPVFDCSKVLERWKRTPNTPARCAKSPPKQAAS